jgi:hypothetical protein
LKNKLYILNTRVETSGSRYDVHYSVWFLDGHKIKYTLLCIDNEKFDDMQGIDHIQKNEYLSNYIMTRRNNEFVSDGDILHIEEPIPSIDWLIDVEIKQKLRSSIRELKINQLIN